MTYRSPARKTNGHGSTTTQSVPTKAMQQALIGVAAKPEKDSETNVGERSYLGHSRK